MSDQKPSAEALKVALDAFRRVRYMHPEGSEVVQSVARALEVFAAERVRAERERSYEALAKGRDFYLAQSIQDGVPRDAQDRSALCAAVLDEQLIGTPWCHSPPEDDHAKS